MKTLDTFAAFALATVLAGCTTDNALKTDGVTTGAGNAIAANTVMQMVDPWPEGVDDTDIKVPSDRGEDAADDAPVIPSGPKTTQ